MGGYIVWRFTENEQSRLRPKMRKSSVCIGGGMKTQSGKPI